MAQSYGKSLVREAGVGGLCGVNAVMNNDDKCSRSRPQQAREERLAERLRDNLRRRKQPKSDPGAGDASTADDKGY